jgi:hypothetical protein
MRSRRVGEPGTRQGSCRRGTRPRSRFRPRPRSLSAHKSYVLSHPRPLLGSVPGAHDTSDPFRPTVVRLRQPLSASDASLTTPTAVVPRHGGPADLSCRRKPALSGSGSVSQSESISSPHFGTVVAVDSMRSRRVGEPSTRQGSCRRAVPGHSTPIPTPIPTPTPISVRPQIARAESSPASTGVGTGCPRHIGSLPPDRGSTTTTAQRVGRLADHANGSGSTARGTR